LLNKKTQLSLGYRPYWLSVTLKVIQGRWFESYLICILSFLLVGLSNSNLGAISYRFRDMATYSLKLSTKNCGQTAADKDMVTIDGL